MSGTLWINDVDVWMPAGWVYDGLLVEAAALLREAAPTLASLLEDATTERSGGFLDLRALSAADVAAFDRAARSVRDGLVREGPSRMHDPSFFAGFVARLDELLSMLQRDPRLATDHGKAG